MCIYFVKKDILKLWQLLISSVILFLGNTEQTETWLVKEEILYTNTNIHIPAPKMMSGFTDLGYKDII